MDRSAEESCSWNPQARFAWVSLAVARFGSKMDKDLTQAIALPCCGYKVDAHLWLGNPSMPEKPEAGSLSICVNCGAILVFVTLEEIKVARARDCMAISPEQRDALFHLRRVIQERGKFKASTL